VTEPGKASESYTDSLDSRLVDFDYAVANLNEALDDGNQEVFLLCLRDVVRANSGFEMTAATAEIGRAVLYRMLSEDGNPRFGSLVVLLDQLGFKLCLAAA